MADKIIRQVQVDSTTIPHEISAKYIQNGTLNKTWEDITALVSTGFTIISAWTDSDYNSTTAPSASKLATVPAVKVYYNSGASSATGTLAASGADTKKHIYLIYHPHEEGTDTFDEYVSTQANTWEKIGNTDVDLSTYAKKGTYTTSGPNSNATGSAGNTAVNTSKAGAQTATGTATVTVTAAAPTVTGSAGAGSSSTTGEASGGTVDFSKATVSKTATALSHSVTNNGTASGDVSIDIPDSITGGSVVGSGTQALAAHSHTVNVSKSTATVTSAPTITGSATGAHTHTVDSHTHGDNITVGSASGWSAGTRPALTVTNTTVATGSLTLTKDTTTNIVTNVTGTFGTGFTVSSDGVLSLSTAAVSVTKGVKNYLTNVTAATTSVGSASGWSAGTSPALTVTNKTVAAPGAAATLTSSSNGGSHTHGITGTAITITYVTGATTSTTSGGTVDFSKGTYTLTNGSLSVTTPTSVAVSLPVSGIVISNHSYDKVTGLSGTQTLANHAHSYTAAAAHTHAITPVTATYTGTASVAVSSHTHSVTPAAHTHSLSSHTHSVTL